MRKALHVSMRKALHVSMRKAMVLKKATADKTLQNFYGKWPCDQKPETRSFVGTPLPAYEFK